MTPQDLAQLTLSSVQYIQTLTAAVFGGGLLLLGQGFLGRARENRDFKRRIIVVAGFTLLVLAITTGFITIELLIEAADQSLVDEKVSEMRWLRILQTSFLAIGFVLIGGGLASDILQGTGAIEK